MAFDTLDSKGLYAGNGVAVNFAAPFLFYDQAHIKVYLVDKTTGALTLQALTTDYTVSGVGVPAGGTVSFLVPPSTAYNVLVARVVPSVQSVDLKEGDKLPSEVLEKSLDLLTMQAQQLAEVDSRCIKLPAGTPLSNIEIPDISLTANRGRVFRVNAGGTGFDTVEVSPTDFVNPLNLKGDIPVHDGTAALRLAVGADGALLEADSTQAQGVKWNRRLTAKGDLLVSTGTGAAIRKAVGSNGLYLRADSTQADGLVWLDPRADLSATQNEVDAMASTLKYLTTNHNKIVLGTPQNSTSGTAIDFTGIPAGVRRITIHIVGVSLNGTDDILVQIGDSGGIETSGYGGAGVLLNNTASVGGVASTAGMLIRVNSAANVLNGHAVLTLVNAATFQWSMSASIGVAATSGVAVSGAAKALSAELDRVRVTVTGANTFDAGTINISYER